MIYKKFSQTELFSGKTNKTYEYNIEDADINYCIVDINGRFPTGEKYAINKNCKEIAHVLSGNGTLVVNDKEYKLEKDDVVLIDKLERYYWLGNMRLGLPCTPAWKPEQHIELEFKEVKEQDKSQFQYLISKVLNNLENKAFFIPYSNEECNAIVSNKDYATVFGAYHNDKLIALSMVIYDKEMMDKERIYYDLNSNNICELGGNLVLPEYRGLKIAKYLQEISIKFAKKHKYDYVISMAHPENVKGCKTLEGAGLEYLKTVKLDSGYTRNLYILNLNK